MRLLLGIFLVLATAVRAGVALPPADAGFDAARLDVARATMRGFVDRGEHAGIITLLAHGGRIVDVQTHGYRDLARRLPMERDTLCRMYSMTKIVTAVGVLCLLEDGRFNLTDPVAHYLPELGDARVMIGGTEDSPQLAPLQRPVTIKDLLTHTSGYIYDFDGADSLHQLYRRADLWSASGLDEFVTRVARLPLAHQPGERFTYGINMDLLGVLVERVAGEPFGAFLARRIFRPLGMKDTGFDVPAERFGRLALTYQHGPDGRLVPAPPMLGVWSEAGRGIESGGAGLFSTADDFARFGLMLGNGGVFEGKRILARKTVELMTTNHLSMLPGQAHAFNPARGYGLGVEVSVDPGKGGVPTSVGQFGWFGAATTYFQVDPRERVVALVLAQHFPFNEHHLFTRWETAYYQALK